MDLEACWDLLCEGSVIVMTPPQGPPWHFKVITVLTDKIVRVAAFNSQIGILGDPHLYLDRAFVERRLRRGYQYLLLPGDVYGELFGLQYK